MRRLICRAVVSAFASGCSRGVAAPPPSPAPFPSERADVTSRGGELASAGRRPEYRSPRDDVLRDEDLDRLWERQLMVPVEGMLRRGVHDDFEAKRGGDKMHRALDLPAPRFTAVLAADDCVIGRLFSGPIGGLVIYASDPDERFVYYYAHLQHYRRGLTVGDKVAKGSVIGYVGSTGNAPPETPHLHFQVMKRGAGRAWWDGPAINPLPFFAFDGVRP